MVQLIHVYHVAYDRAWPRDLDGVRRVEPVDHLQFVAADGIRRGPVSSEVAGSQSFLAAFERLAELQAGFDHVIVKMLSGQIAAMNILQLAERVVAEADNPSPEVRRRANKYLAPKAPLVRFSSQHH